MQADQLQQVFGANVRRRRLELGITQGELARRAGVPQPNISDIENGKQSPTFPTLARIAEALSIPPSHLLSAEVLAQM